MNYVFFLRKQLMRFLCLALAYNMVYLFAYYLGVNAVSVIPKQAIITFAIMYIFIGAYIDYYYNCSTISRSLK